MLELKHITKTFKTEAGDVTAVDDVSLSIRPGEIFGIIGFSGAGKSTLVRCINLLERPTSGEVVVDGTDLTKLSDAELRVVRRRIEDRLSEEILQGRVSAGASVVVDEQDGELTIAEE